VPVAEDPPGKETMAFSGGARLRNLKGGTRETNGGRPLGNAGVQGGNGEFEISFAPGSQSVSQR